MIVIPLLVFKSGENLDKNNGAYFFLQVFGYAWIITGIKM